MSNEAPVFTLRYGGIELVIAEQTLSSNCAPFTIISPADAFNSVDDSALLAAFQSQFTSLEQLVPKSIPMLRAYATLIMFYRISQNANITLTHEQAKAGLMGEHVDDTLLFIVAKLLRDDDAELRRYVQQPHILVSSLLRVKQEFILGDGNVVRLFQQARVACEESGVGRLTMKQFTTLYQEIDPSAGGGVSRVASKDSEDGQEEKKVVEETEESIVEEEQQEEANTDVAAEGGDDSAAQLHSPSAGQSHSSSSSTKASAPIYRSSSSSRRRAKTTANVQCINCYRKDRPTMLMLCDRVDCTTACHYGCCNPPLSAVPAGAWFCATCKPLVRRALEEEQSLLVQADNKEEKQVASVAEDDEKKEDQVGEISAEQWQQRQEQWQRERLKLERALAAKDAEMKHLRAEVERFKRQRVEREEEPMEEERKEPLQYQSPEREEQKETSPRKGTEVVPTKQKRRGRAR